MIGPVTRIAPTPSGRLHEGNAVNFLLASWWARELGARLDLRIDDVDEGRLREEYLEDVFEVLDWLGVTWMNGPRTPDEAHARRSDRVAEARRALEEARTAGLPAYACACSRSQVTRIPTGGCPGGCRTRGLTLEAGRTALRIAVPEGTAINMDGQVVRLDVAMGDFVIWRRDDIPAYQWVSLIEDTADGVTHILRGEDLRESSAAQVHLAQYLPNPAFLATRIRHHGLVVDVAGIKLSKSTGAGVGVVRDDATLARIRALAVSVGSPLGIGPGTDA